jgi:hypothetical protein
MTAVKHSVTEIGQLLGGVPREAAEEAAAIIAERYPDIELDSIPPEAWQWIATGEGEPPWHDDVATRASLTSLMSHFEAMNEQQKRVLLQVAAALV